ncbi:StbE replicon stabilization toxin [uncultured Candidatus Thioglobus sp.]|nr:StbE replicon stabilization toxin [uncultured Candidatus Thioglobus sp.]
MRKVQLLKSVLVSYKLKFLPSALKEWKKLASPIQKQFKKKLAERIVNPEVPASKLRGIKNIYKIKLRSSGYRLIYEVNNSEITIYVVAVGKRERGIVYNKAEKRT